VTAAAPPPPADTPPSNTSAPAISGQAQQGQTLTADPGTWSGTTPLAYAYRWRRCDAAGAGCAFSGGASRRFAALARALRAHPVTAVDPETGETITFTYNDLIAVTLGALYAAQIWPDLAAFLADLESQAAPAALGERLATIRARLGLTAAAAQVYPNDVEGSPGVTCSDTLNPRSFAAWQRAADEAARRYGYFGRVWNWTWSSCRSWPSSAGQDRHLGPWNARTSAPVLVVGNYFDPATRYQGAVAVSRLLPNSRLLSYAGWGHAAYFIAGNFCVDSHVTRYLLTGQVPPVDTVCQPEGSPLGPTSAATPAETRVGAALHALAVPEAVRRALHAR
jgi:hypothetical protein